MKKILLIIFVLSTSAPAWAAKSWIFNITRNKNRNVVQYAIKYDAKNCTPTGKEPVYVYWRDLEVSPKATSSIGYFEKRAYGIKSQRLQGGKVFVKLKALEGKTIEVTFDNSSGACKIKSYTQINGKRNIFKRVYVFAKEGLMIPTVMYIDVIGRSAKGKAIKQRIKPD